MGMEEMQLETTIRAVLYSKSKDKGTRVVVVENRPYPRYKNKMGFYRLPGGTLEPGENDLKCITRELREELGIYDIGSISKGPIGYHKYRNMKTSKMKVSRTYIVGIDDKTADSLRPNLDELLGCEVLNPRKAINMLYYKNEKDAVVRFCKIKGIFK